ncbi:MAG: glutamine-hydrolyzing carbamoyl-phosphate synthase small subunit [Deltaproteobacteria bacterium]|nr:glutamine-hydrolyzing carbamoyl-phosphate synthase small subunit [Deltaproteobacteria bacterium]
MPSKSSENPPEKALCNDAERSRPALLVLEDGFLFRGKAFGAARQVTGELVFNTSMTGYPELLSDPSYKGQLVTLTTSEVGNYGVCKRDMESDDVQMSALLCKNLSPVASNWRSGMDLDAFLKEADVPGMYGFDTRALVRHIRDRGTMRAAISTLHEANEPQALKRLLDAARAEPRMAGRSLAKEVGTTVAYSVEEGLVDDEGNAISSLSAPRFRVVALDCGMKKNIGRLLHHHGCEVRVLPPTSTKEEILAEKPHGLFVSNGPGDPASEEKIVEVVKSLVGALPIFGICLGHQLLSQALGAKTYKTHFGHRGANQPVKTPDGRVLITSQNHGFAVKDESLQSSSSSKEVSTFTNVSDGTNEGLIAHGQHAFSVQYHPEAAPGPKDAEIHFADFVDVMAEFHKSPSPLDASVSN